MDQSSATFKSKLRVLILWTFQSTYIEAAINCLIQSGHTVTVIYCENLSSYPQLNSGNKLAARIFLSEREIPNLINKKDWDVVFVAGWHVKMYRRFLRLRSDIPRIMYTDTQNQNSTKFIFLTRLFRVIRKFYFDGAFVPGARQVEFVRRLGFSEKNCKDGGITYDNLTFKVDQNITIDRNGPFLYVGRISEEKNLLNLCLAYNLYRRSSQEPRNLVLIGPQENFQMNLTQGISYLGYKDKKQISDYLGKCRAFVLPSFKEPFGVALLEAAACGAPIMTSRFVGSSANLVSNKNGFVVDPEDYIEMGKKLLQFDKWDLGTLKTASLASQEYASSYAPKNWVLNFEELYVLLRQAKQHKAPGHRSISFYLTVIPKYRTPALNLLQTKFTQPLQFYANETSTDSLVKTDKSLSGVKWLRFLSLRNVVYLQIGHWLKAFQSDCLIIDLNPRNITSWLFLVLRSLTPKKRTIVWGHLNSRFSRKVVDRWIRKTMCSLAEGIIVYTYSDLKQGTRELSLSRVFVAPNSIAFRESQVRSNSTNRNSFIYSGRLVKEKKLELLLKGFAESMLAKKGIVLTIIGTGPERDNLLLMRNRLNLQKSVIFPGEIYESSKLGDYYSNAIASVSPGYAGLSLTQSAGFGVPMILAKEKTHSPEIELIQSIKHYTFESDDSLQLASELIRAYSEYKSIQFEQSCQQMVEFMQQSYCYELMVTGLFDAITDNPKSLRIESVQK